MSSICPLPLPLETLGAMTFFSSPCLTSTRLLVAGDTWLLALCWGWALDTGILSLLFQECTLKAFLLSEMS